MKKKWSNPDNDWLKMAGTFVYHNKRNAPECSRKYHPKNYKYGHFGSIAQAEKTLNKELLNHKKEIQNRKKK